MSATSFSRLYAVSWREWIGPVLPSRTLLRYSLPFLWSELLNGLIMRLDLMLVGEFAPRHRFRCDARAAGRLPAAPQQRGVDGRRLAWRLELDDRAGHDCGANTSSGRIAAPIPIWVASWPRQAA